MPVTEIRDHVMAVESVLRTILEDGRASGTFDVPDLSATMSLIHACQQARNVAPDTVEQFVLSALQP